jgi:hypothetical protein
VVSPYINRFLQPDSIIPNPANPQSWNRYSYVANRPTVFVDPTGHESVCGSSYSDPECENLVPLKKKPTPTPPPGPSNTPTPTNTPTPAPTGTPIPTPTGIPSTLDTAISLIQNTSIGNPLYEMLIAEGFKFEYSRTCNAHNTGTVIQVTPCRSAVFVAGNIAHEAMHENVLGSSLLEEYKAYFVGDAVRNQLIQAGYGTNADLDRPLTAYNVDITNPNRIQLSADLVDWFRSNRLGVYIDTYYVPALPRTMFPSPSR